MKGRHQSTLEAIFALPVLGTIKWRDIEALLAALGADIEERRGSRVAIVWKGQVQVFHRPHPSPDTKKGAVRSVRLWLEQNGVKP